MAGDETLELVVDSVAQGGDGVGRHDGLVVFARGGLPGERVRVRLYERHPSYARGQVDAVLEPSPERVAPRLSDGDHAPWQHIAYPAQLRLKATIVREQLVKLAGASDPPVAPVIAAPRPWGYRNSAHLHVEDRQIGYHVAGTRMVADLPEDPLLLPALNEALAGLRAILPSGVLTGVTLRASVAFGYVLGVLRPTRDVPALDLLLLAEAWRAHVPALAGVAVEGRDWRGAASGVASLLEELQDTLFELAPTTFFQVNLPQAGRMLDLARAALCPAPGMRLLDLYAGAGAFALPLAAAGAEVIAVEEHAAAVADGERSAALNDIRNVRFVQGAVERVLPGLAGPFDGVLLDPPRRGCHPTVLEALARLAPPRVVYISCHPGILGRDLAPLLAAGYRLEQVQPLDLFPQTPHVETVVTLSLQPVGGFGRA